MSKISLEELNELLPAYTFEHYIASGAMGSVYKAHQTSLDRTVAIKLLHPEYSQDAEFRANFEREAIAMARLNHPNLVQIYDFGKIQGMLFIVMEYVVGQSLYDTCDGKTLVPEEAVELTSAICKGLQHAHSNGILHRDIKPANILVNSEMKPIIVDFGIAEPVGVHYGEGKEVFATPDYAAPETCYHGQTIDGRADIYSLGVMLYELLTSDIPEESPHRPSDLVDCPESYDAVVLQAIEPDPDNRYPDALSFGNMLDALLKPAPPAPSLSSTQQLLTPLPDPDEAIRLRASTTTNKSSSPQVVGILLGIITIAILSYLLLEQI